MKGKEAVKVQGLTREEVLKSREINGENKLSEQKRKSFLRSFISNLNDPIIRVLIIALLINIIFMFPSINWFESGGIGASILISTFVSTISEYSSENAFEKMKKEGEGTLCLVRREGRVEEIHSSEIVVGDIMLLSAGGGVWADGKILSGEVSLDESALTGESREVKKHAKNGEIEAQDRANQVLKGSVVVSGYAECVVTQVGEKTYYGRVARELGEDTRPSPLKNRLSTLAKAISKLGYIAAGLVALAYLFYAFVIEANINGEDVIERLSDVKFVLSELLHALTLAVSIVVVAVPEGLPMMITVVLSSNMKKMMKDSVLVRKLVGIETSGNINLLFTDKTGTLTEGKLKLKEVYNAEGEGFTSQSALNETGEYKKYLSLCANFCTYTELNGRRVIGSDATDRAIREFFLSGEQGAEVKKRLPFDSANKYSMSTVIFEGKEYTLVKGAPEKLILASSSYMDKNGKAVKMTDTVLAKIKSCLSSLTKKAYRVVAMGIKEGDGMSLDGITFLSLLAIRDKIRREVPSAIKEITGAGVGVVMITGDNKDTAEAIAKECGIISSYTKRTRIITGAELDLMTDGEIAQALPTLAVIARALPSDKSRLVKIAQGKGYVVGMTGDGINDASSLKTADVGFAMGSGTEVAKEASDIVISNNNFASIVKAVLYGRTIFESIRKFIVFQLTMNLAAVGISLLGPFIHVENPVTITQMLWVNIIMDTLGALAFASEPALGEYMKDKPKRYDEPILSKSMLSAIALNGSFLLLLCVWFLKSDALTMLITRADDRYVLSAFFAMFIFSGIFVCFTARTTRVNILAHLNKNKAFIVIMLLISALQMIFIYFGNDTFRTTPLKVSDLITVILISLSVVFFDFVRKLAQRLRRERVKIKKTKIWRKTNDTE